jgi:hypothetical protein
MCVKRGKTQTPVLTPVILAAQEAEIRRITVWGQPRQIVCETLSWKYSTQKRAGGVAEVVECLPSKRETLCSNLRTAPKRGKRLYSSTNVQANFKLSYDYNKDWLI